MKDNKYDIAIIGGGIVGLAHAYFAVERGLKVVLFERNQFSLGASIRNFGLIWPIGQNPEFYGVAMKGRNAWTSLSTKAPFGLKENGSLHLAYHEDEWAILNDFVSGSEFSSYDAELISPDEIKNKFPHIESKGLFGGLLSHTECTVDPREAVKALAAYLKSRGVDIRFGKTVTNISMPTISTFDEGVQAENVIVCSGADFETLYPDLMQSSPLTKCKLQMMRTHPVSIDLGPSLCAGLTLRHYDAFSECPSVSKMSQRFDTSDPDFKKHGVHVLVSQNNAGELVIGDSHEYADDLYPFDQTEIDNLILDYLRTFFSFKDFKITEKWHGIYPKVTNGATHFKIEPEENVLIVNGLGGAGMTLSFGLAAENIEKMLHKQKVDH